jgi:hypothetical protein
VRQRAVGVFEQFHDLSEHARVTCDVIVREEADGYACLLLIVLVVFLVPRLVRCLVFGCSECTRCVCAHAYAAPLVISGGESGDR